MKVHNTPSTTIPPHALQRTRGKIGMEPGHGIIEKRIKMKKTIFNILAKVNKVVMPSMAKKDLTKLTNWQKAIVAYRYWVTTNALE
jgi:hypothetical protein